MHAYGSVLSAGGNDAVSLPESSGCCDDTSRTSILLASHSPMAASILASLSMLARSSTSSEVCSVDDSLILMKMGFGEAFSRSWESIIPGR
jgi:hypothetical protein